MAIRLITWILLTMLPLQGGFAASTFHCQVVTRTAPSMHASLRQTAPRAYDSASRNAAQSAQASTDTHYRHGLSARSPSGINHHTQSNGAHHRYKMSCCDSAGGTASSLSLFFPPDIEVPIDVERPDKLADVFLDRPKRPPKLFHT